MNRYFSLLLLTVLAISMGACCNSGSKCNQPAASTRIVVTACVEIKPDKVELFKKSLEKLATDSRAEAGNISYNAYQPVSAENKFFFYEEWKDQAAIDFHFAAPHFKSFGAMLDTIAAKPAEIKQLEVVSEK